MMKTKALLKVRLTQKWSETKKVNAKMPRNRVVNDNLVLKMNQKYKRRKEEKYVNIARYSERIRIRRFSVNRQKKNLSHHFVV